MDNATNLIADADVLLERGSYGRARSLTVLAQEELGKALWLYQTFAESWSTGAEEALTATKLTTDGRSHAVKYMEAFVFGRELEGFWGVQRFEDLPLDASEADWQAYFARQAAKAEAAGKQANADKMAGFYVDLDKDGDTVHSPADIGPETIADDLRTAAQVVEMLLITDHSRMKFDAVTPYDSTHAQQYSLLPITHPEDWQAASETFTKSDDTTED